MKKLLSRLRDSLRADSGATATEYAVILALVIIMIVGAVTLLGERTSGPTSQSTESLQ